MSKLSIAVVTMNRSKQLIDALNSCLKCVLEKDTFFIIIDNASTDDTEDKVKNFFNNTEFEYFYEKMPYNLGVGGGRNYAFSKSKSKYTYFLDDDAIIDSENNKLFFKSAIELMDNNKKIVTLTTQIYDRLWKKNRVDISGKEISKGVYSCKSFCGGSHFLRNDFFVSKPYFPNKYGFEEIPPSLIAINEKKVNAFTPELLVIHCPVVDKWNYNDEKNYNIIINECAVPYAIKRMMYPVIYRGILDIALKRRCKKYLNHIADYSVRVADSVNYIFDNYKVKYKISLFSVIKMFFEFGFSIF